MKVVLFILAFCFATSFLPAQEAGKYALPYYRKDTVQILALIDKGRELENSNLDSGIYLLNTALQQSREIGFESGIAKTLITLGNGYALISNTKKSIECYREAIPHCYKCPYCTTLLARVYASLGNAYTDKANYAYAAYFYYQAQQEIVNNRLQDSMIACRLYVNLGAFWINMQQYNYAINYLLQSEKIALYNRDTVALVGIYENIGIFYLNIKEPEKTYNYLLQAEKLIIQKHYYSFLQPLLMNMGNVFLVERQPLKAIPYYEKAISLNSDDKSYEHNIATYYFLANALYEAGNYPKAEKYALTALQKAAQLSIPRSMDNGMITLARIYEKEGKYKDAYSWLNKYSSYKDSLTKKQIDSNVNKLEVKYQLSEKNKEIAQKQLKITQQEHFIKRNYFLIGGISIITLLSTALFITLLKSKQSKQHLQAEQINNFQQKQKIDQLNNIMKGEEQERGRLARELHDGIGGMLAAIKMNLTTIQTHHQDEPNAKNLDELASLVEYTADEVRKTAHNLSPSAITTYGLHEALRAYFEQINTGDLLQIDLQFDADLNYLDKASELAIYRILQELIQNIIKHSNASQAVVQIRQRDNMLNLTVEDNGIGFDINENKVGLGLQNINYRVNALQGYISIESVKNMGTTIHIEFDINNLKAFVLS